MLRVWRLLPCLARSRTQRPGCATAAGRRLTGDVVEVLDRDGNAVQRPLVGTAHTADVDRKRGTDKGPLHGIPVSIKDLYDIAGQPTTSGRRAARPLRP